MKTVFKQVLFSLLVSVFLLATSDNFVNASTYGGGTYGVGSYNVGETQSVTATQTTSSSGATTLSTLCQDANPVGQPDLFQINRTKQQAKLYFTPVNDNVKSYHVVFGYYDGDERFGGINITAINENKGVQSITIGHLDEKIGYSFKVVPVNGCATGTWSNWLSSGKLQAKTSIFYRYWQKVKNIFRESNSN